MHVPGSLGGQEGGFSQTDSPSLQKHDRQEVVAGSSEKRCPDIYVLF